MRSFYPLVSRLLFVSLLGVGSLGARAQTLPPGQGLVADTTELRVLRQFYAATGGPQWTTRTNWLQGTTLAEAGTWFGVGLDNGDVTSLVLRNNHLVGPLPAAFGELRQLQSLALANNQLSGPLPASMARQVLMNQCFLS